MFGNRNQTVSSEDCVHCIHLDTPDLSVYVSGVFVCALGFTELQIIVCFAFSVFVANQLVCIHLFSRKPS